MKTLFKHLMDTLAESVVPKEGIRLETVPAKACDPFTETIEENLMEAAFAEAADYDDIHTAIMNEPLRHCAAA
jgi:hypothetical protein